MIVVVFMVGLCPLGAKEKAVAPETRSQTAFPANTYRIKISYEIDIFKDTVSGIVSPTSNYLEISNYDTYEEKNEPLTAFRIKASDNPAGDKVLIHANIGFKKSFTTKSGTGVKTPLILQTDWKDVGWQGDMVVGLNSPTVFGEMVNGSMKAVIEVEKVEGEITREKAKGTR